MLGFPTNRVEREAWVESIAERKMDALDERFLRDPRGSSMDALLEYNAEVIKIEEWVKECLK